MYCFSLAAFLSFLILVFWILIMMCLGMDFVGCIIFNIIPILWTCKFVSSIRKFSAVIYLNVPLAPFSFSFWHSDDTDLCSTGHWGYVHFFHHIFLSIILDWVNFIDLYSSSPILSSVILTLLLNLFSKALFLLFGHSLFLITCFPRKITIYIFSAWEILSVLFQSLCFLFISVYLLYYLGPLLKCLLVAVIISLIYS